jgi:hypothetical protein
MTDPPVTTREIAELLHLIRELSDNPASDPTERADLLARKADLLARLAHQRANEWDCEHADQARQLAHEARTLAAQARSITTPPQHDPTHR